jgi:hypothetical protein
MRAYVLNLLIRFKKNCPNIFVFGDSLKASLYFHQNSNDASSRSEREEELT